MYINKKIILGIFTIALIGLGAAGTWATVTGSVDTATAPIATGTLNLQAGTQGTIAQTFDNIFPDGVTRQVGHIHVVSPAQLATLEVTNAAVTGPDASDVVFTYGSFTQSGNDYYIPVLCTYAPSASAQDGNNFNVIFSVTGVTPTGSAE